MNDNRGRFKRGTHWRPRRPYWDRDWLHEEYVAKSRTCSEIASQFGITENAIHFWLKRHGITARAVAETRRVKRWGSFGERNPMWGLRGPDAPNWKGGTTPLRQAVYSTAAWRLARSVVWNREDGRCQRCGSSGLGMNRRSMHYHHILSFSTEPELRCDPDNLALLCQSCHRFVHSRDNVDHEYLSRSRNPGRSG
jgi:5-methylcytosine-specific restriction endonuclease McrA